MCAQCSLSLYLIYFLPEHTQDKQIQRDNEYYEGDNDNDHDDGTRWPAFSGACNDLNGKWKP
jgi:hypothetical protein